MNEKSFNVLKIKTISEVTIPKQLQDIYQIISCLSTENEFDDSSILEVIKIMDNSSINPASIIFILKLLSFPFPKRQPLFRQIMQIIKDRTGLDIEITNDFYHTSLSGPASIGKSVALDQLDDLVGLMEKESFDINMQVGVSSIINYACRYGSEKCFTFLKLNGALISDDTLKCAVEGGNKNIIMSLINEQQHKITDQHLTTALMYHRNDVFDWLLENKGSIGNLNTAECFYYGNLKGLLFLIENGFDINNEHIFQLHLFIIFIIH